MGSHKSRRFTTRGANGPSRCKCGCAAGVRHWSEWRWRQSEATLRSAPLPGADPRKCLVASNQTCFPGVWRNSAGRNASQEDAMSQVLLVLKHMIDSLQPIVHHYDPLESHYVNWRQVFKILFRCSFYSRVRHDEIHISSSLFPSTEPSPLRSQSSFNCNVTLRRN